MAESDAASVLRFDTAVDGPTWISAVARGPGHPNTLDESVLAHTSPMYVDVAGRRVGRAADARWCLEFLDTLERFVDEHGRFAAATRDERFGDLVAVLNEAKSFYRSRDRGPVGGTLSIPAYDRGQRRPLDEGTLRRRQPILEGKQAVSTVGFPARGVIGGD